MSFGERLRSAREAKGYTQQQVADFMQIDKSTYCGYETGKRQPDVQKIKLLSKFLGVSGDELLETGYVAERSREHDVLDDVDIAFYDGFRELSEDEKDTVRDMVMLMRARRAKREEK